MCPGELGAGEFVSSLQRSKDFNPEQERERLWGWKAADFSIFLSWEQSRYLPSPLLGQPHTVICLLSTFQRALCKHFPLRLPPCSLASPPRVSAGGAPRKQPTLWGSVFFQAASSFRRSFTRLALTSMSYSGAASEKVLLLLRNIGVLCCNGGWIRGPPIIKHNSWSKPTRWLLRGHSTKEGFDNFSLQMRFCKSFVNFSWFIKLRLAETLPGHLLVCKLPWCITLNGPKKDTKLTFTHYIHIEAWRKTPPCTHPLEKT